MSPLLFILVMTVLVKDAGGMLSAPAKHAYDRNELAELVYADDTLIMGVADKFLAEYLNAFYMAGKRYGMELHPSKFQLLSTSGATVLHTPSGEVISISPTMEYLGAILSADGKCCAELGRRIGRAKANFMSLAKVWSHSSLTWPRKLRIFDAMVESKLTYAMGACCLLVAQERRINGFQNRCIRKILGIKPAFISRVSNAAVLERAHHRAASEILRKRRLLIIGKVFRAPPGHPMRSCCFIGSSTHPASEQFVRRVGRPSKDWTTEVLTDVIALFGSVACANEIAQDCLRWKQALRHKLGF